MPNALDDHGDEQGHTAERDPSEQALRQQTLIEPAHRLTTSNDLCEVHEPRA
jgi:hypothetical protein